MGMVHLTKSFHHLQSLPWRHPSKGGVVQLFRFRKGGGFKHGSIQPQAIKIGAGHGMNYDAMEALWRE